MTDKIRQQLTLFVEQEDALAIEKVRAEFNPIQSALIKSHVTLCREDEIENIEKIFINISAITTSEIVIEFYKAIRFDNGNGVLLPAKPNNIEFKELRRQILSGLFEEPRSQEPHITLMHPRNSVCTDDIYKEISDLEFPTRLVFRKIELIQQINNGQWIILQTFPLPGKK